MRISLPLLSTVALFGALSVTIPRDASSGVPSAFNSTVPSCVISSPGGDIVTVIIVRDLASLAINNSFVVLDYSNCPGFVPCPQGSGQPNDNYVVDLPTKTIRTFTNGQGQATLYLRAGGGCSSNGIVVYADGVFLGSVRAASTDQNGDLSVDGADVALVHAKIGTTNLTGDLDCDFDVDASDEAIVAAHVGTNCLQPTEDRRQTWGRVKLIYR